MKKDAIFARFLPPGLLILLGLVLLVSPDSASALIANILGWVLIIIAIGCGISAVVSSRNRIWKTVFAIIWAIAGGWLHQHPLMLAYTLGRFCGIFLWITGVQNLRRNHRIGQSLLFPGIQTGAGLLLFLFMPMSVSRLVFALCGIVLLVMGGFMLLEELRPQKRLEEPENPDIIDAL